MLGFKKKPATITDVSALEKNFNEHIPEVLLVAKEAIKEMLDTPEWRSRIETIVRDELSCKVSVT